MGSKAPPEDVLSLGAVPMWPGTAKESVVSRVCVCVPARQSQPMQSIQSCQKTSDTSQEVKGIPRAQQWLDIHSQCVVCREVMRSQCLVYCSHCRRMLCPSCKIDFTTCCRAREEYDEIFGALLERVRQPSACGYCGSCEAHRPYGTHMEEEDVILANGPAAMYVKLSKLPKVPPNTPHDALEDFEVWQWDPEHQEGPTLQCAGMDWATYEEQVRPHWPVTDMTLHIVIGRRTSSG